MTIHQVKGAETDPDLSPTLAMIPGYTLFWILAWKQAEPSQQIMVSTSSDGINWSTPDPIPAAETDKSPSLTIGISPEVGPTDPLLYAAWKGKKTGTDKIYYSTWYNPQSTTPEWQPQLTVPYGATTDSAPALTTNDSINIVVAWATANPANPASNSISYTTIPEGAIGAVGRAIDIGEQTPFSPTVASVSSEAQNYLLFAWSGISNNVIWYRQLETDTSGGTHQRVISSGSFVTSKLAAPALPSSLQLPSGSSLGLAWVNDSGTISVSNDFPGAVPITEVPDTATNASPAYGGPGGLLAFTAADGKIYTCVAPG
jgi:hypothetical protein